MKKFRPASLILIICLLLSLISPAAFAAQAQNTAQPQTTAPVQTPAPVQKNDDGVALPTVGARYVVLADLDTGKVIFSRAADEKAYPASLTKIMTVLLAVEAVEAGTVKLDDKIEAFDDCRADLTDDSSTSDIVPGEIMTFKDLLYCALVESANEACNIIAEHLGGSISGFVDKMNARAAELGCKGTHFANPHGLPNDNHYTTANDMYAITKEAISHDLFMTICNTQSYTVPATNKAEARTIYSSNALLTGKGAYGSGYVYDYAAGVKTGHTEKAGYCVISTAEKNSVHLISVVMGAGTETRTDGSTKFGSFSDAVTLYKWAFENYKYFTVCKAADLIAEVKVKYAAADDNTVTVHPDSDVSVLAPATVSAEDFEKTVTMYEESPAAPINAGQALGEVSYSLNGKVCGTAKLVASSAVELSQSQLMKAKLHDTFTKPWVLVTFWLVVLLILAYVVLVIRYRILRQRHLKEKRRQERERARAREQAARDKVFSAPRMEYFYDSDDTPRSRPGPRPQPPYKADENSAQRDYFDEFFRREEEQNQNKKKR